MSQAPRTASLRRRVRATAVVGAAAAAAGSLTLLGGQPAAAASTEVTLWPSSATPATASISDRRSMEVGVRFTSTTTGAVSGVAFYKGSKNGGDHYATLWTASGTQLARVYVTNETASGWQTAHFSSPVRISAGTTYVVSYHANDGGVSSTTSYFANRSVTNGPLTAMANSNGVIGFGVGTLFPTTVRNGGENFWVEPLFVPDTTTSTTSTTSTTTTAATASPTSSPTASPTATATSSPTASPTATATSSPTASPTATSTTSTTSTATVTCGLGSFSWSSIPTACWRPYSDSSPFNRLVPASPKLLSNSAAMVSRMISNGHVPDLNVAPDTTSDWYHPIYYPTSSDPLYTIHCTKSWGTCAIEGMQVRIPAAARPAGGGDGHMTVIDQASGWEYDFWQVQNKPTTGGTITISWGGRTSLTGDGLGSDATAAHFGLAAGIIRAQELAAGHIDHALFLVTACTANTYVWPAQGLASTCSDTTNAPPVGQYMRLGMSDAEIAALSVPAWKKTILTALAHYGAYVGDTGGNESFGFQLESSSTYTSFGATDQMAAFAAKQTSGVSQYNGQWLFDMNSGVDWTKMQAIDPCVAARTC